MNELITESQAIEIGKGLQVAMKALETADSLKGEYGDMVASIARVRALKILNTFLDQPEVEALIIAAAGDGYEVAESGNFKLSDGHKLEGAKRAMRRKFLIADEDGPQFSLIVGKGGVNVLIKETGHRYKLRKRGASHIDIRATAREMRKRSSSVDKPKYDMIVDGVASCELNGEVYRVERSGELPIILPCYETDGPDGHEAKARRRLARDLWAMISGEVDPIELDEAEGCDAPAVHVMESSMPKIKGVSQAEASFKTERDMVMSITSADPEWSSSVMEAWDAFAKAESVEELKSIRGVMSERGTLAKNQRLIQVFERWYQFRKEAVGA